MAGERTARGALTWATLVALAAVLLLAPLPAEWGGGWRSKLLDLGHVPLFAALAACLWRALGCGWPWPVAVTLALAAGAEVVQAAFGRSGNAADFLRGALGVAAAVVVERGLRRPRSVRRVAGHALALAAVLAWPVADALPWLLDGWEANRDFPTLADFSTGRQGLRWTCRQATLTREPDARRPSGWSGRLDLLPGPDRYPSAALAPVTRDWSAYRHVGCSFTVTDGPLVLVVSIRGRDELGRSAHHQFERLYPPGEHTVRVELAEAARRAQPAPFDLADVSLFQVFTYRPDRPRTVYLHRVWLE